MVQGRCMKEKKNVVISNPKFDFNSRGTPVAFGKCPSCGGKVYKMLSTDDLDEAPAEFKKKVLANKAKKGKSEVSRRSRKSKRGSCGCRRPAV